MRVLRHPVGNRAEGWTSGQSAIAIALLIALTAILASVLAGLGFESGIGGPSPVGYLHGHDERTDELSITEL